MLLMNSTDMRRARSCTIRPAQSSPPAAVAEDSSDYDDSDECPLDDARHYPCEFCGGPCRADDDSEYSDEDSARSSVYPSTERSCDCECDRTVALDDMGIFGPNGDPQDYLLPIVKVSLDIGAYFKNDSDVPDPMASVRLRDALVRCVCYDIDGVLVHPQADDLAGSSRTAKFVRSRLLSRISSPESPAGRAVAPMRRTMILAAVISDCSLRLPMLLKLISRIPELLGS